MINNEIAEIFEDIADLLEIKDVEWKPAAFRKAARNISTLSKDLEDIYKKSGIKGLKEIPGVGEALSNKIEEYIKTEKIKEYEQLKKSLPSGLSDMMEIQGLGPKKVAKLYKKLKINTITKLEAAVKKGKIRKLEGFGEKSEEDILMSLGLFKIGQERTLLGIILPLARDIEKKLKSLKEVQKVAIAGSIRRRKETVKDIDILVMSKNPKKVMDFVTKLDNIKRVLSKGSTKTSFVLEENINCDIRIVDEKSYGAALAYFTGNKDHNIKMRQIAIKKGYKLSEYGIFSKKGNKYVVGKTEQEIYKKLGLNYIEPELRQNSGELEAKKLPDLIPYNSIKGDLHVHTNWTDGSYSTEDMIKYAKKLGYEYIAITDHSKSAYVANGLDEKRLLKHIEEIKKLDKKIKEIKVFAGSEVDILKNGKLDYNDNILKKLDFVIASIHSRFKDSSKETTARLIKAINNKYVNCIGHITGRLINQRNPYEFDFDKVFEACKKNNVAIEINAFPSRLDLKDIYIRRALEYKLKFIINTDSHSIDHFKYMELGIAQAKRGWATKNDILNTLPLNKFGKVIAN